MWIYTQDDSFVNCDNIYMISVRKNSEGWEIYADNVYDKRAKLGVYKNRRDMDMTLALLGNAITCGYKIYKMSPDNESLLRDEVDEIRPFR